MIEPSFIGYFGDFFPKEVVGRVTSLTGVGDNLTSMLLMLSTGIVLDRYSYFSGLCGRRCDSVVDDRMRRVHFGPCPAR